MGELLIILVVVLILFGAARLPQLGSSLGQAIKNFKRGFSIEDEPPSSGGKDPATLSGGPGLEPKDADRTAKTSSKLG
jgi:sec-independent protein translocase protein TatA